MPTQIVPVPYNVSVNQASAQIIGVNADRKFLQIENKDPTATVTVKFDSDFIPARNAVQNLSFNGTPNAGSFVLSFGGYDTPAIPFSALAADIQTALVGLTSIGAAGATVTGTFANGFVITFIGANASLPQSAITIKNNTLQDTTGQATAVQNIAFSEPPTAGTFKLVDSLGNATAALAYNISNTDLATALNALGAINNGIASISQDGTSKEFSIIFQAPLANQPVPLFTVSDNSLESNQLAVQGAQNIMCTPRPLQGQYTLMYGADETLPINFNDLAATIQARLEALPSIGSGNVVVNAIGIDGRLDWDGADVNGYQILFTGALVASEVETILFHSKEETAMHPDVLTGIQIRVPDDIQTRTVIQVAGKGLVDVDVTPYNLSAGVAPLTVTPTITVTVAGNAAPTEGLIIYPKTSEIFAVAAPISGAWAKASADNTPVAIYEG